MNHIEYEVRILEINVDEIKKSILDAGYEVK